MLGTLLQFAQVDVSVSGDSQIVPAPGPGRRVVVAAIVLNVAAETDLVVKGGAAEVVDLGGFRGDGEPAGLALGFNPHGYFEAGDNAALILNLSSAAGVRGWINYFVRG